MVYENHPACKSAVGGYLGQLKSLWRTWTGICLGSEHADMSFVQDRDEVKNVRRLSDWLQKGTDNGRLDLACCCLSKLLDSYHLEQETEEYEQELALENASVDETPLVLCSVAQSRIFCRITCEALAVSCACASVLECG